MDYPLVSSPLPCWKLLTEREAHTSREVGLLWTSLPHKQNLGGGVLVWDYGAHIGWSCPMAGTGEEMQAGRVWCRQVSIREMRIWNKQSETPGQVVWVQSAGQLPRIMECNPRDLNDVWREGLGRTEPLRSHTCAHTSLTPGSPPTKQDQYFPEFPTAVV
jgi:hypothetical protein